MDGRKIAIGVILVAMVALISYVFILSANTEEMPVTTIFKVNDNEYTVDEYKKYSLISNEAGGDISKKLSEEEKSTMADNLLSAKMYSNVALKNGITLPSGEIENFKKEYSDKNSTFAPYGVTEEDYLVYKTDSYLQTELMNNFGKYYELPKDIYDATLEAYSGDQKSYAFRLMSFGYEVKSGDSGSGDALSGNTSISGDVVSGDVVSGDAVSGDTTSGDQKEDNSKVAVQAKAQDVLNKLNSGSDFKELAQEFSTWRYTFKGSGYTLVNGDIEYAASPLIESKLGSHVLHEKIETMASGEVSELIDDSENNTFYILKLESVEDGFVGESDKELREVLLSQAMDSIVVENVKYEINQAGLFRALYK